MSYDLFFRAPDGVFTRETFGNYFGSRPNYEVNGGQAFYQNDVTGVYFSFDWNDPSTQADEGEQSYSVAFNINYCRPSFFGLEAEPEVTAFVKAFGFAVEDPQMNGMGHGPYDDALFLSGWNVGNAFGVEGVFRGRRHEAPPPTRPTAELHRIWAWNAGVAKRQKELGEDVFVPRIMFGRFAGRLASLFVWGDGIPTVVPSVDSVLVLRRELAPRRWLGGAKEDRCVVPGADVAALVRRAGGSDLDGGVVPGYTRATSGGRFRARPQAHDRGLRRRYDGPST